MKNEKPTVAIVAGELAQPRMLSLFEGLRRAFEPTVFALETGGLIDRHGTSLKMKIFEPQPEMPVYMRGIEDQLAGMDLVIAIETSRLSSFQAVRAARKLGIPAAVVVNEFQPFFYAEYANIRAIQHDITANCRRIWPTSELARAGLVVDGVGEDKLARLPLAVDVTRFRRDQRLREKFRRYVQIGDNDLVVLYVGDLDQACRPMDVLLALTLLKRRGIPGVERLKVIFAGDGPQSMELKYRSADSGLGRNVMFLHQDLDPFIADLYAASDIVVSPRVTRTDRHEEIPLHLLEAMSAGMVPVVQPGTIGAELVGTGGVIAPGEHYQQLALALEPLVSSPEFLEKQRNLAREFVVAHHSIDRAAEIFCAEVRGLLSSADEVGRFSVRRLAQEVEADMSRGRESDALVKIEEALLIDPPSAADKAMIHCLRGEVFYSKGEFDKAVDAFTEAVKLDDKNHRAFRGLGYIAWQGHSSEEALTFFRKALARSEGDPETMLGIGLVYRRLGLTDEALYWLEKTVLCDPAPASALTALCQACMEAARPESAISVLERVIEALGEKSALLMTMGQLYLKTGKSEIGNRILQKALDAA